MPDLGHGRGLFVFGSAAMTAEGGHASKYVNKTGGASVKGTVVKAGTAVFDSVELTGASDTEAMGIMWSDGVADGSYVWVVTSGKAYVLLDEDTGSALGDWAESSEAGYAGVANSPAAAPEHFQEIAHVHQASTAGGVGTHQLVLMTIHFN